MTRDIINVQYPTLDHTESVANICIEKTTVVPENGVTIEEAFSNKNNSLFVVIENNASDSLLTVKAGDAYPNAMLGDLVVTPTAGQVNAILLEDIARFENRDGSVNIDFASGFAGTIYAVAKRAGIKTEY